MLMGVLLGRQAAQAEMVFKQSANWTVSGAAPGTALTDTMVGVTVNAQGPYQTAGTWSSTDGTYGALATPAAPTGDGAMRYRNRTSVQGQVNFTVMNNTGKDLTIEKLHFDFGGRGATININVGYVGGAGFGGAGNVVVSALAVPTCGDTDDYHDYEVDFTGEADHVLANGEQVVIFIRRSSGDDGKLDNIYLEGSLPAAPPGQPVWAFDHTVGSIDTNSAQASCTLLNTNADVRVFWGAVNASNTFDWAYTNDLAATPTGLVSGATLSDLVEDTRYFYIFYASNTVSGLDSWSFADQSFVTRFGTSHVVTDLVVTANQSWYSRELSWTDNFSTETAYVIERSTNAGSTWATLTTVAGDAASYNDVYGSVDGILSDAAGYHYRIAASNAIGLSGWSASATAASVPKLGSIIVAHHNTIPSVTPTAVDVVGVAGVSATIVSEQTSGNDGPNRGSNDGYYGNRHREPSAPTAAGGGECTVNDRILMTISNTAAGDGLSLDTIHFDSVKDANSALNVGVGYVGGAAWGGAGNVQLALYYPPEEVATVSDYGDYHIDLTGLPTNTLDEGESIQFYWKRVVGGGGEMHVDNIAIEGSAATVAAGQPAWAADYTVTSIDTNMANASCTLTSADGDVSVFWGTVNAGESFSWAYTNDLGATPTGLVSDVTLDNLVEDTQYHYIFYASNTVSGLDDWSAEGASFVSKFGAAHMVTDLVVTADQSWYSRALTWTDSLGTEAAFVIERSTNAGLTWTSLATVAANATSYDDVYGSVDGILSDQTYHYRIAASNAVGLSAWSASATAPLVAQLGTIVAAHHSQGTTSLMVMDVVDVAGIHATIQALNGGVDNRGSDDGYYGNRHGDPSAPVTAGTSIAGGSGGGTELLVTISNTAAGDGFALDTLHFDAAKDNASALNVGVGYVGGGAWGGVPGELQQVALFYPGQRSGNVADYFDYHVSLTGLPTNTLDVGESIQFYWRRVVGGGGTIDIDNIAIEGTATLSRGMVLIIR